MPDRGALGKGGQHNGPVTRLWGSDGAAESQLLSAKEQTKLGKECLTKDYEVCWAARTVLCVDTEAKDQKQSRVTRGGSDPKPVADVPFLVADAAADRLG